MANIYPSLSSESDARLATYENLHHYCPFPNLLIEDLSRYTLLRRGSSMHTVNFKMNPSIRLWQWPNILAIDTALVAILWQLGLVRALNTEIGWAASAVLGLSVWLTYVADRLFDVRSREKVALFSLRHQFAKRYHQALWYVWFVLLAMNLLLARKLTAMQLKNGCLLLLFCLIYTILNQKLSRHFFPKEICVALIYASGVIIFMPVAYPLGFFGVFALLCLLNCLMIGAREKVIDAKMHVHSIATLVAERWLTLLALFGAGLAIWRGGELWLGLALSLGLLGLLHGQRKGISMETFRVLADASLVLGALYALSF